MEISVRIYSSLAEVTFECDNVKVTEDVAIHHKAPEPLIEELITAARDLSMFNDVSGVEFVKKICDTFLQNTEIEQLVEELTSTK